jgi:hypothetical protein
MPNTDCIAWMRQTAADYRYARTNAFAGLHVPFHYRSANLRTIASGPQAGTDTSNTVISLNMMQLAPAQYTFTAQGMPAPIDAYTQGGLTSAYVTPLGGTGVWSVGLDSSHAVAYSYGMYLLEGERHFMQATLELATNVAHQTYGNVYGSAPTATYSNITPYQSNLNIPATEYSGIAGGRPNYGDRNVGWAANLLTHAAVVCPDADVQSGFMRLLQKQHAAYQVFNTSFYEPGQLAIGCLALLSPTSNGQGSWVESPWMSNFCVQGYSLMAIACEDGNAKTVLNNCLQYVALGPWANGQPYRSNDYRQCPVIYTDQPFDASANPFMSNANVFEQMNITVANNIVTLIDSTGLGFNQPTNGDFLYFLTLDCSSNTVSVPAGASEGVKYYVVNATATTFQVATSPGGSPIPLGASSDASIGWQPRNWTVTPAGGSGQPTVYGDSYSAISAAALVMASKAGANAITSTMLTAAQTFLAPVDTSSWVTWRITP